MIILQIQENLSFIHFRKTNLHCIFLNADYLFLNYLIQILNSDPFSINRAVRYPEFQNKLSFVFHMTDELDSFCTKYSQDICKIAKKSKPYILKCLET